MKRRVLQLLVGLMMACWAQGQEDGATPEFKRRANQWMTAPDPAKRKAAYRSWLMLSEEAMPDYRTALEAAAKFHAKQLTDLLGGRSLPNPYAAHQTEAGPLDKDRQRVMPLIKTDWKKDPAKIKVLRDELKMLAKRWSKVQRLATADTTKFDATLEAALGAMTEVARELERFDANGLTPTLTDEELQKSLLAGCANGNTVAPQRERLALTRTAVAELAAVEKHNATLARWATPTMKSFATLLNAERGLMGFAPLRLEEKLSAATLGHSGDMARLGFFAHESPVEGKTTPWDRARLAGFVGNGTGENIFMGSPNFAAAYMAWFGSDGHRFILFGDGCNALGVGVSGVHWTMMTGSSTGTGG